MKPADHHFTKQMVMEYSTILCRHITKEFAREKGEKNLSVSVEKLFISFHLACDF